MNKQLICDYINYNAPKLHGLGDKLRAMVDVKYRFRHLGPDIVPSQIFDLEFNIINIAENTITFFADRGIKGISKYTLPSLIKVPDRALLTINSKESHQEYILNLTSDAFFWDNFAIFHSNQYWMLAIIPELFELPQWIILDKYDEFINVKFANGMSCPVIETEDSDYNTVLTPIDNEYIQDLIS